MARNSNATLNQQHLPRCLAENLLNRKEIEKRVRYQSIVITPLIKILGTVYKFLFTVLQVVKN